VILRRYRANIFGRKWATVKRKQKVFVNCEWSQGPYIPSNLVNFGPQAANTNCMHGAWRTGASIK